MVNKEGDPELSRVMEARDSQGNPEKESNPDFDYYADLIDEELDKEFEKLLQQIKYGVMSALISTPDIHKSSGEYPTKTSH